MNLRRLLTAGSSNHHFPLLSAVIVVVGVVWFPAPAQADFGFLPGPEGFSVSASGEGGATPDTLAGSHPYALTTTVNFNLATAPPVPPGGPFTDGDLKDLRLEAPPGLIEDPAALPQCTQAQFHTPRSSPFEASLSGESCPGYSQVGVVAIHTSYGGGTTRSFGVFNLEPPPGAPSQIGFAPYGIPIALTPHIRQAQGEYGLTLELSDLSQRLDLYGLALTLWGTPWSVEHNGQRGNCLNEAEPSFPWAKCSTGPPKTNPPKAYLTLPTSCAGPLSFTALADSWQRPGAYLPDGEPDLSGPGWAAATFAGHDEAGHPLNLEGCESLAFEPLPIAQPTNPRASSPSGFDFDLETDQEGLTDPVLRAPSPVKKAVVALPEGITIDPSLAAGLGVCTPAQYAAETVSSPPGAGCPNASKIGDFTVRSPLFEKPAAGAIFLAQPYRNPFGSLLALYLLARSPQRGVLVKLAGQLSADPATGRLTASFDDLPQLPYTHLEIHFREGQRSPLTTPAACGSYATRIDLSSWRDPSAVLHDAPAFPIANGIGGGPCPGPPPFAPAAQAGTLNSNAGAYTPFYLHLTRTDAEQEITSYSAKLPPGLLGKIAAVPYCPEADIEAAKGRTGTENSASPSCPAASEIGHTETGYGVGSVLAYAPGRLYLAGPYHGAPLSVVAIDSATVGPFDLGTIVIRSAIEVDPHNAQVSIDSAASDPIPHILDGIPLHLRDIRVYISRPHFTLNPTSCEPFSVASTLTGSSAPFTDPKDATATATVPFQAAFCSERPFAPNLSLRGGAKRGDFPTLKAVVTPRPGDANIGAAAVTLPPSLFLEQAHIRRPCTGAELEAEACRPESVYGHARAFTPLLAAPMEGPVYLRSSSADALPDLVAVLHGAGIRIVLTGRIDSSQGGLRGSFEGLPDAPVTRFEMTIYGGKKRGILVDAANLCVAPQLATARFVGQNDSGEALHPRLAVRCPKHRKRKPHRHRGGKR